MFLNFYVLALFNHQAITHHVIIRCTFTNWMPNSLSIQITTVNYLFSSINYFDKRWFSQFLIIFISISIFFTINVTPLPIFLQFLLHRTLWTISKQNISILKVLHWNRLISNTPKRVMKLWWMIMKFSKM